MSSRPANLVFLRRALLAAGAAAAVLWAAGPRDRADGRCVPVVEAGAPGLADGVITGARTGEAPPPAPPDPDGVGPCPARYAGSAVVRRGLDALGRPSWWHEDGSVTVRAVQTLRLHGEVFELPVVVHATPR